MYLLFALNFSNCQAGIVFQLLPFLFHCCFRNQNFHRLRCDIFTCALVSSVAVPALHLRTLHQCASQATRCLYTCHHIGLHRFPNAHPIHIGGDELLISWSTTRSSCSSGRCLLVSGSDRRKKIHLRPSDQFPFRLFVALWLPQQFLQCYICLKVSMKMNFALDYALLVNLVINTTQLCQMSAMDCVVMHSSQHKKLA